ncbi:TldD/PmbA family protein, partial [Aeromonas dhakensis]
LQTLDRVARAESPLISQFSGDALGWEQEVTLFNSEGLEVSDRRHYNRLMARAIAMKDGEQSVGYEAPGALMGWEHSALIDPLELAQT